MFSHLLDYLANLVVCLGDCCCFFKLTVMKLFSRKKSTISNFFHPKNVVCRTIKSKTPTMYEGIQKAVVKIANFFVFAGNVVDFGRHNATSQIPKTIAGTEKTPCKMFMINRRVVLENASREVKLRGSMNITVENPIIHAHITISRVISWTK